ncbi:MAG: AraC family transcriptional regulator ligand-binding domain-containing protein, partial [Gammaproteobacteria bacterium]|nr:AraC family transcriptional regulator ligand-binding domain-containing protein [Gammaproteobacteria bacterium]
IPSDSEEEYVYPIPLVNVATLFEAAVKASNNTCVGLNMAQQYHYESASVIILAMLAAPSVEQGISCLCRYDQFIDTGIETRFNPTQEPVQFSAGLIDLGGARVDQLNEYLLAFVVQILNTATRKRMPVKEVWFRHDCDQNAAALEEHFKARVKFGQHDNCLFFKREFLRERFLTSNNLLFDILTDALKTYFAAGPEKAGIIDAVYREILRQSGTTVPSMETIAASLALSPRTLRRRLAEEGYSFQEVKNMARDRRAKYYLSSTNLTLSEIAFELGYSELSAFSRAFRSRAGEAPQAYRDKLKQFIRA